MNKREKIISDLEMSYKSTIEGYSAYHYDSVIHGITTNTLLDTIMLLEIQKQEPVKRVRKRRSIVDDGYICYKCPACEQEISRHKKDKKINFCWACGQGIKWEC